MVHSGQVGSSRWHWPTRAHRDWDFQVPPASAIVQQFGLILCSDISSLATLLFQTITSCIPDYYMFYHLQWNTNTRNTSPTRRLFSTQQTSSLRMTMTMTY